MKFDLHTHHDRCGHAVGKLKDYVEAGIDHGLKVIGIADHSPYFYSEDDQLYPHIAMGKTEFPKYVKEVLQLKETYQDKIQVLLGVESDFFTDHLELYRKELNEYPFDYIIGSVHYVDDINIFKKGRWEGFTEQQKVATKETYYNLIEQSARSGLFQILGHIDAMKGFYPAFSGIETDIIDRTLKIIGEQEVAIEINTSGKTKDSGGWYPADDILERAHHFNVNVTFGSDAHVPERVGDEFDLVAKRLKEIGFKEWYYFVSKKKCKVTL